MIFHSHHFVTVNSYLCLEFQESKPQFQNGTQYSKVQKALAGR